MKKFKVCMVAVLGLIGGALSPNSALRLPDTGPTGGYPVTDRHTGKAKERREAKRRRRAKGRK